MSPRKARVFGWLWLLLARALLCYGRPDRRIEIRGQVHYNEKTDEIRNATMKIDQCPEYNFRNNFYYAVTCAGFVRVFMDQEWRTKKKWDEKKGSTFIEDWQEDLEQKLKENMHRKCYNNDKFKVFYYKEDHRHSGDGLNYRLIFLRYGEHNSPVRMWITEDLLESRYKYETLFEEFPHPTNWDFMGYANQNGEEGSNYVCDPESSSYDPETEDFHFPHGTYSAYFRTLTSETTCTKPGSRPFQQIDSMRRLKRPIAMAGSHKFPYRHIQYLNQVYNRHSIVSLNYPNLHRQQSPQYAAVLVKDSLHQRMRDAAGHADTVTLRQPCYIRVNRPDLGELHEMLILPHKEKFKFVLSKDEAPLIPTNDDFTGNNVSDVPYTVHENADEIHLPDQYYDDQDAVDAAVQKKAQKPVKVKLAVPAQFNVIFAVSLLIAGFVF
ncbi:hypothetical protein QR680_014258 [Steinernema hermaphroditum]|uniref:Uncharacterized protein n=1 Tax=Steinernema hermaphroditum TaxID=289476 RepID=A0AA39I894_9BILA|nr:hypothetical protein QR680_014258 [Steinernema hermaphroditum]